jgi:hypothetical protein
MGVDTHQHIGPYVEVVAKVVTLPVDGCRKPDECPDDPADFCPKCGIERQARWKDETGPEFTGRDLAMITSEALRATDVMCDPPVEDGNMVWRLIPNRNNRGTTPGAVWRDDDTLDLTDVDIPAALDAFRTNYQAELTTLENKCGPLTIRWGFIQWYS